MSDERRRAGGDRPSWPPYLEPLRPDEVTSHRLRRNIVSAAEALFEGRAPSWFEVTAGWSSILAPLAAGLLLVFGAMAYRAAAPAGSDAVAVDTLDEPVELVQSLAPDAEAPPALLISFAEPTRDAVLTAALITP